MLEPTAEVRYVKGVGEQVAKRLARLHIATVGDLIAHLPFRYDDFSKVVTIHDARIGEAVTVAAEVQSVRLFRTPRKRMLIVEATIADGSGSAKALWYNQPFLVRSLAKGTRYLFAGKFAQGSFGVHLSSPVFEPADGETLTTGRIAPVYSETKGITSKFLRKIIRAALGVTAPPQEVLSSAMLTRLDLMGARDAQEKVHFPGSYEEAARAQRRFIFEDLFLFQLKILRERVALRSERAPALLAAPELISGFLERFPFRLTDDQQKALAGILAGIGSEQPMNRLLQGETGSGKTVIAETAAFVAAHNGFQTVLMAPTEILARQHFRRFLNDFASADCTIALLLGKDALFGWRGSEAQKTKRTLAELIRERRADIIIGTHALLNESVRFARVGLVVIDEQQRFGVGQRGELVKQCVYQQNLLPHFLSMTATPIPRTMALVLYGDFDVSVLTRRPPERKPVKTLVASSEKRERIYAFTKRQLEKGFQAFIVCPRVEEGDGVFEEELKAVKKEYEVVRQAFPEFPVEKLYGTMKPAEKERVMREFAGGQTRILVASSVIEVGIDVPNATVMLVEGAERFGLSQLHQMRGRVGRSSHQAYAFFVPTRFTKSAVARLRHLERTDSALELAEADLRIRGPGQFFGTVQAGLPDLAMKALKDRSLLEDARAAAEQIVTEDPLLTRHPLLKQKLTERAKILFS